MKEYTIVVHRRGRESEFSGTIDRLVQCFSYTLEVGRSWEREKGNAKIDVHPKTAKSLVTNLNRAVTNAARNGCPAEYYSLKQG